MHPSMGREAAPALHVTRAGLKGDGVGDRLFELLWKRDLFSDSALALRIPDTVIFRYSAPAVWYFTSVDGTIKRKTKAKVNANHIFEDYMKRPSDSGIIASYVYSVRDTEADPEEDEEHATAGTRTTIEYLNRDELWHLLFNRQKVRPDGILQKFVEPKGGHNNMIRVLWSPKVCLLERRVNNKKLSDTKYDVYERAVTFEGSDFLSEVTPVRGPSMVMQVHEIADAITQHIAAVTSDKIKVSRMALNFKVDDKDRLWLLFASSIRLRDELNRGQANAPLEANAILQIPDHIRRIGTTMPSRPAALQCSTRCPTCEDKVEDGALCDVSYKVIIEYEEMKRGVTQPLPTPLWPPEPPSEAEGTAASHQQSKLQEVPEPLQLLHPRLTSQEYSRFRHDVAFLYKSACVCEGCYLRFSAPQLGSQWKQTLCGLGGGDSEEMGDSSGRCPLGEALNPERLKRRQQATERRVHELKAAEDGEAEEFLRCKMDKPMSRAQSCPQLKLPSWGPGHNGPCVRPPAAVLESRPRPPNGAAPLWVDMRPGRQSPHLLCEMEPQRRRRVPKLLGAPYLHDLQEFAIKCPGRAHQVVPTMPPTAGQRGAPGSKRRASSSSPALPTVPAATLQEAKPHLHASSSSEPGELEAESSKGLSSRAAPLFLDDDGPLEAVEADPLVANLWEKWPESRGTTAGGSANTTRPPSAATRPSSGGVGSSGPASATSRNSSRPMSRVWSAQSTSRPSNSQPSQSPLRTKSGAPARPSSSPLIRGRAEPTSSARTTLHRPTSSPQIRPQSAFAGRPPRSDSARGHVAFDVDSSP